MNIEMAYLLGMILGNGEIQQNSIETKITIDIPHKNLYTDDMKDTSVYVKASLFDIQSILEPLIGQHLIQSETKHSTKITFSKPNNEYVMREILRLVGSGTHHSTMKMNEELFSTTSDEKKALLRGIADVKPMMYIAFIAYFIISLPAGYFFAFVMNLGIIGVWMAFPFGLTSAGIMYYIRFRSKTRIQ